MESIDTDWIEIITKPQPQPRVYGRTVKFQKILEPRFDAWYLLTRTNNIIGPDEEKIESSSSVISFTKEELFAFLRILKEKGELDAFLKELADNQAKPDESKPTSTSNLEGPDYSTIPDEPYNCPEEDSERVDVEKVPAPKGVLDIRMLDTERSVQDSLKQRLTCLSFDRKDFHAFMSDTKILEDILDDGYSGTGEFYVALNRVCACLNDGVSGIESKELNTPKTCYISYYMDMWKKLLKKIKRAN
jgi:hypothetical protein